MIELLPVYGLCNRMFAIRAGIELSQKTNLPLTIYWVRNRLLFSSFQNLFEPLDLANVRLVECDEQPSNFDNINPVSGSETVPSYVDKDQIYFTHLLFDTFGPDKLLRVCEKYKTIHISSFANFMQKEGPYDLSIFKPVQGLAVAINNEASKMRTKCLGIHIRRTDNFDSIINSPLDLFIDAIKKELKENKDASFYLSSDNMAVKKKLLKKFPGHIITSVKEVTRITEKGMEGAVIDLFTLAQCNKIIGSYYSTFSKSASYLGHIPIEIVRAESYLFKVFQDLRLFLEKWKYRIRKKIMHLMNKSED